MKIEAGYIAGKTIVVRKDNRIVGFWIPSEFKIRKQTISFYDGDEAPRPIEKILSDTEEWFMKKAAPGHEFSIETIQVQSKLEASAPELLEASEQLIEAMNQKNFFMEGYANGSASISEVREFSAREHEAYSKLFDVIKKAKGQ